MHDVLIDEITEHAERMLCRLDELKNLLAFVQNPDNEMHGNWASSTRDARALAIVCSLAELESLTKFLIQETHRELNDTLLFTRDIRPSIRQVAAYRVFESLRSLQDHAKLWERREYATTLDSCIDTAEFPIERKRPQPPLDGRTLRPEHYYRIWAIYGLPDDAFPYASWASSLQKLALLRNDIAHGNLVFDEIFKQAGVTVPEVEQYINNLSEFSIHLVSSWSDYLTKRLYLIPAPFPSPSSASSAAVS